MGTVFASTVAFINIVLSRGNVLSPVAKVPNITKIQAKFITVGLYIMFLEMIVLDGLNERKNNHLNFRKFFNLPKETSLNLGMQNFNGTCNTYNFSSLSMGWSM